jgi:hypothetical protein
MSDSLDARMVAVEALSSRNPPAHNSAVMIVELILVLMLAAMIGMLSVVMANQARGRSLVAVTIDQNEKIINSQQIMMRNTDLAVGLIKNNCGQVNVHGTAVQTVPRK